MTIRNVINAFYGIDGSNVQMTPETYVDVINTKNEMVEAELCAWCGTYASTFKDKQSKKEYSISGLCQDCQDKTFNKEEDNVYEKEGYPSE